MANDDNTTVSFRLPPLVHEELMKQAEAAGTTKHQLARILLVRSLGSPEVAESDRYWSSIEEAYQSIQLNLRDMRIAFGRGIGAILQQVAPDMDTEEIRRWVFDRIVSPSKPPTEGDEDAEH